VDGPLALELDGVRLGQPLADPATLDEVMDEAHLTSPTCTGIERFVPGARVAAARVRDALDAAESRGRPARDRTDRPHTLQQIQSLAADIKSGVRMRH